MDKFQIDGPCRVKGKVLVSGSKNASLPILAATLLFEEKVILENVPMVKDILTMINLLETLGKKIIVKKNQVTILNTNKKKYLAKYDLVKTMRAGILVLGP